jgi:hypothetical protein
MELLERPNASGEPAPWDRAAAEVGFDFPKDYREFVDAYGAGAVNDELFIAAPTLRSQRGSRSGFPGLVDLTTVGLGRSIAEMRENAVATGDEETYPLPIHPEPGGLLIWGYNSNTDVCFWDTCDTDPDRWSVVVFLLSARRWERFDGGMTEFLLAVLRGEHPLAERLIWPIGPSSGHPVWDRQFGWAG